jgi:hypothetical protein
MGWNFCCKEQYSTLPQYHPNTCYLSIRQLRKSGNAGKCIAVAVACVGVAAEPKVVLRLISFPNKHRAERTCEPYGRSSCEIYRCHC